MAEGYYLEEVKYLLKFNNDVVKEGHICKQLKTWEINFMEDNTYDQAKELFIKYQGNVFHMERDNLYKTFQKYNIPNNLLSLWYKELLLRNKEELLAPSNNKEITNNFFKYLELIRCNIQYFSMNDIKFAFDFFYKQKELDDFSKLVMIEIIINFIKDKGITDESIKKYCKEVLVRIDTSLFTVDDSYKYNGELPPYVLKEKITQRILDDTKALESL